MFALKIFKYPLLNDISTKKETEKSGSIMWGILMADVSVSAYDLLNWQYMLNLFMYSITPE